MNPVVYNENGQYRFSDFVGYLPEFLKTEPDVVTLMQIMSDYINNAYRNLESTTQFELMLCCIETDLADTVARMEKLQNMFSIAAYRNDKVSFLSAPRNNIKSNMALGNVGAEYPIEIKYDGALTDTITVATARGIGDHCTDGQVVYVTFRSLEPEQVIPFYYDKASNTLLREPNGTSQDPFDDSYNQPSRILEFDVSDVGSVSKRYGNVVDKVTYYEVFFTLTVSNITNATGCATAKYDVDSVDGDEDNILVDYYNATTASQDKYQAVLKFADGNGFAWKSGFPTGIFYFRESSGANLVRLSDDVTELSSDPTLKNDIERYSITGLDVASGVITVYMDSFPGLYDNAIFYLVHRKSGNKIGQFKMSSTNSVDRYDSGSKYITLVEVDGLDPTRLSNYSINDLVLVVVPLFCTKKTIDYTDSYKVVRWTDQVPECNGVTVNNDDLVLYGTKSTANSLVGEFTPSKADKNVYGYYIYTKNNFATTNYLFCNNTMWQGIAKIKNPPKLVSEVTGLYQVELDRKLDRSTLTIPPTSYELFDCKGGFAHTIIGDNKTVQGFWEADYQVGDYVVFEPIGDVNERGKRLDNASPVLLTVASVSRSTDPDDTDGCVMTFTCSTLSESTETRENWYKMTRIVKVPEICIDGFRYRKTGKSDTMGAVKWSHGDIFIQKHMLAYDLEQDVCSLFIMSTDVRPAELGVYEEGEYVSDGVYVYKAIKRVSLTDLDLVSATDGFAIDKIAHYSLGLKTVSNAFMPYCGQFTTLGFNETPDYVSGESATFTRPLYIKRLNDTRLKYGWQQRQYMNYGSQIDNTTLARNGFVEIYSDGGNRDIVTSDLANYANAYLDYTFVPSGNTSYLICDVDTTVVAVNNNDGTFTATVKSSDHGLVDGCEISMYGLTYNNVSGDDFFLNAKYVKVSVIDADSFTYVAEDVHGLYSEDEIIYAGHKPTTDSVAYAQYCRDYMYPVKSVRVGEDGRIRVECVNIYGHCDVGTKIRIEHCTLKATNRAEAAEIVIDGEYEVISDPFGSDIDQYICISSDYVGKMDEGSYDIVDPKARLFVPINTGDIVFDGRYVYRVGSGLWDKLSRTDLATPFTIFARQNYIDVTDTNRSECRGDEYEIRRIIAIGGGRAMIVMKDPIKYLTKENARYTENKTMVYIQNVYPTYYGGWHTITKVHSPGIFEVSVKSVDGDLVDGTPVVNRKMTLYDARWYKYTVKQTDWDKISNCATYVGTNIITNARIGDDSVGEDPSMVYIYTSKPHGFNVGDRIVFDISGNGCYKLNSGTVDMYKSLFRTAIVSKVKSESCFIVNNASIEGDALIDPEDINKSLLVIGSSVVFAGVVLDLNSTVVDGKAEFEIMHYDHLELFRGEYTKVLHSLGNKQYRFKKDDIVIAFGQINPVEIGAWRVMDMDTQWMPIRSKRVIKVGCIEVDMMRNPEYDGYDDTSEAAEYKYITYNDVQVANYMTANHLYYTVANPYSRNFKFEKTYVENIDTTQHLMSQFSSKYDYASVAPRNDIVDSSFRGIPDMKYPLIEKIERIAYLKDMNVIDIDLIGYLARYMGYDITAIVDDINSSNIYKTTEARNKALRETIEHLPQYYSLGGTQAGLNMLMATFGIVADVLTMWTNTSAPYDELLTEKEVQQRVRDEITTENVQGTWVPTPHISMRIPVMSNFKNILLGSEDVAALREQIRVFKPINVVFDGITMVVDAAVKLQPSITTSDPKVGTVGGVVAAAYKYDPETESVTEFDELEYDTCNTLNCVF